MGTTNPLQPPPGYKPVQPSKLTSPQELESETSIYNRPLFPMRFGEAAKVFSEREVTPTQGLGQALPTPLRKTYGQQMPAAMGAMQGAGEMIDFFNTPVGAASAVAVSPMIQGLSKATRIPESMIQGLMKVGFTAQGIHGLTQSMPEMKAAFERGDIQEGTRLLTHNVANMGMAATGATMTEANLAPTAGTMATIGKVLGDEGGFMQVDVHGPKGRLIHRYDQRGVRITNIQGDTIRVPKGSHATVTIEQAPNSYIEADMVNARLKGMGFNDENTTIVDRTSGQPEKLTMSQWMERYGNPPAPTPGPTIPQIREMYKGGPALVQGMGAGAPVVSRTPSGARSFKTATTPTSLGKVARTQVEQGMPREYYTSVTDPAKPAAPVLGPAPQPYPMKGEEVYTSKPVTLPSEPEVPGAPAPPAATPMSMDDLVRALVESNNLMRQQIQLMHQQYGGGAPKPGAPTSVLPEAPALPAAQPPVTPAAAPSTPPAVTPPAAAPPVGPVIEAGPAPTPGSIERAMAKSAAEPEAAFGVDVTGPTTGAGGKPYRTTAERDAYYAKLAAEKRAGKERVRVAPGAPEMRTITRIGPTGKPETVTADVSKVKAATIQKREQAPGQPILSRATPQTPEELQATVDAFEQGKGPAVQVKYKGREGQILYNVRNYRTNAPTGRYAFMPNDWDKEPWVIGANDFIPIAGEKSTAIPIPRFGQRTTQLGPQITVPRKPGSMEKHILPDDEIGVKVEQEIIPADQATEIKDALRGSPDPEDAKLLKLLEDSTEENGTIIKHRMYKGRDVQRVTMRHKGPTVSKEGQRTLAAAEGRVQTPQSAISRYDEIRKVMDPEYVTEGEKRTPTPAATSEYGTYFSAELRPLHPELKPSKTKPSTKITPATKKEFKRVEKAMKKAGGEVAKPEFGYTETGASHLPEPPTLTDRARTPQEVDNAVAELQRIIPDYERMAKDYADKNIPEQAEAARNQITRMKDQIVELKARKELMVTAQEQAAKTRKGKKAGASEPIKPTPPPKGKGVGGQEQYTPGAALPERATTPPPGSMSAEEFRKRQETKATPEEAKRILEEMRKKPKTSAKLTEPSTTKSFTVPREVPEGLRRSPRGVRLWGERQARLAKRSTPPPAPTPEAVPAEERAFLLEWAKENAPDLYKEAQQKTAKALGSVNEDDVLDWLMGKTTEMPKPSTLYRGVPKGRGSKPAGGQEFTHATPWESVAERAGKFGGGGEYDVLKYPAGSGTKYYRGGSLAGDPLESTRIKNIQGMAWEDALNYAKKLYKGDIGRFKATRGASIKAGYEKLDDVTLRRLARDVVRDIRNATFETDVLGRPGIWRGKSAPKAINRSTPVLRSKTDLRQRIADQRAKGIRDEDIPELRVLQAAEIPPPPSRKK
ncbi:MAG: hypothetical protein WC291_00125 [Thermodesulfovibrionales bacterium]|jgi:hypothetical protein